MGGTSQPSPLAFDRLTQLLHRSKFAPMVHGRGTGYRRRPSHAARRSCASFCRFHQQDFCFDCVVPALSGPLEWTKRAAL
jgi:hypothetical protein